jgi:hypothetical protein
MPDENVREMWSEDELDRALTALRLDADTDERLLARVRTDLLISAGGGDARPAEAAPGPSRRWPRVAVAAAAVALLVATVLTVRAVRATDPADSGKDIDPVARTAAVKELNVAADNIEANDEPLRPGQYRYIATHAWWMSYADTGGKPFAYLAENLLETWVPANEKDDWLWRRDVTGARKWVVGNDADARAAGLDVDMPAWPEGEWRAPCGDWFAKEEGREPCRDEGSWQTPNEAFMASLPRDPEALYQRLRADTEGRGKNPDLEMLVYTADLLRSGLVPADLRAALYRALAKVPGVVITEGVANLDGRKGTAFGVSGGGQRDEVIIDRATGLFIGERKVSEVAGGGLPAGTVSEYTAVETAVVDAMGVRPAR